MTPINALENLYNLALDIPGHSYEAGELYKIIKGELQKKQLLEDVTEQDKKSLLWMTQIF